MIDALQFLSAPPDDSLLYIGIFDSSWIIISILLAIVASYAALNAVARAEQLHDTTSKLIWTLIGAFTLGTGVWAMHFIGMLALNLPCGIYYDPMITLISMIPGILASGVALGVGWHHGTKRLSPLLGSILLGAGIGTMHYTGMAAMRLDGFVRYDPSLFVLSIIVAIALSYLALRVKNGVVCLKTRCNILLAVIIGGAVSGMHYTAMSASYFVRGDVGILPSTLFTTTGLATIIAVTTAFLALAALALANISRNRQVSDKLRESEEILRSITNNTETVIFLKDKSGRYLYVNRKYEHLFHVSNEAIRGKTDHDIFPRGVADDLVRNDLIIFQSEQPQEIEEQLPHDDGMHTYLSIKFPIKNSSGEIYAVGGISTDITERKQAEDIHRIAATAFESQESMMVTDADGVILRVNQAFIDTTGYTAEEAVGQKPSMLKSGLHDADFYHAMWEAIQQTGAWQGEIWDRRKNGEIYPKWLSISAVKGEDGVVTHHVGSHIDITERKAAEEKIAQLAFYDPLTLLPNRRLLHDRLQHALASSNRSGRGGALLFIDLDNFKRLNDTLGHDVGDLLLQQVARRLESCVREGDTVARIGGDEFVVILEVLSQDARDAAAQTEAIGKKIHVALNQRYQLDSHEYHCTASIGAVLFNDHQLLLKELMKQADIAMYQAKKAGRNTLRFFDPQMQSFINSQAALESELGKALEKQQFQLYYQIQVDSLDRPLGAETLIRWIHPERGFVSPAEFIPLAEESEMILSIGQWVLDTACAQLKEWQHNELTRDLIMAVNVSARQFHQADFVAQVLATVQRHAVDPRLLKLELTEGMLVANIEDIIATMNTLKKAGIQFSLDDFGTGYSSLQYLKRLPLDQLKIDQSFVRDIVAGGGDNAIVQTIIAMAKSMKLDVIAEGVETEEQRLFLSFCGCHHYQGYLFSKPVPIAQFEELLKQKRALKCAIN
jgi:diguanylate cyclase (GGDEF)-like protein/PAS domain S-box-containing protein